MAKAKASSDRERASLLRRALLMPDRPRLGAFRLRPFSLWTLDLCEEIGLDFFLALPDGVEPAGSRTFQLAALVWAHDETRPRLEIDDALASGAWRAEAAALARDPRLAESLEPLLDYIAFFSRLISAATVRVKPRPKREGEKDEKPPANLLEPGQAYALVWSISGGSIESPRQFRRLYRETPLPLVLSLYHCALRAALVWTVPSRRAGKPADPERQKKAAAARALVLGKREGQGRGPADLV